MFKKYRKYKEKKEGNRLKKIIEIFKPAYKEIESCIRNPLYNFEIEKTMSPCRLYNYDYWVNLSMNENVKMKDIALNESLPWHYKWVCLNPNVNIDFIKSKNNINWNWLSCIVKLSDIENNLELNWNWDKISNNSHVTETFVEKHIDKNWNYYMLSYNKNISFSFIKKYREKNWNWIGLSYRDDLTLSTVLELRDKDWYWSGISISIGGLNDILNYIYRDLPWHFKSLSLNKNLTCDIVEKLKDKKWDWEYVFLSLSNMSLEFIEKFFFKHKRCFFIIVKNINFIKNIDLDIFIKFLNNPIFKLSEEKNRIIDLYLSNISSFVGESVVRNNLNLNWDWKVIFTENLNISVDFLEEFKHKLNKSLFRFYSGEINPVFIENNPDLDWCWDRVSLNKKLNLSFINKHRNKLNFKILKRNNFSEYFEIQYKKDIEKRQKRILNICLYGDLSSVNRYIGFE